MKHYNDAPHCLARYHNQMLLVCWTGISVLPTIATLSSANAAPAEPIHAAVSAGDLKKMKELVQAQPDLVNQVAASHWTRGTPLHFSLRHPEVMSFLLEKGADPNRENRRGQVPLMLIAVYGKTPAAELLLRHGAKLEVGDEQGYQALHYACRRNRDRPEQMVQLLLSRGAEIEARSVCGITPLHVAAHYSRPAAEALLAAGASVEARDGLGKTPLFFVRNARNAQILLDAGAKVNVADHRGWTPLHEAAYRGVNDLVELLLTQGARLNALDTDGWTPLHATARAGNTKTVALLLKKGARAHTTDARGWSPLREALLRGLGGVGVLLEVAPKAEGKPERAAPYSGETGKPEFAIRPGQIVFERPTFVCLGVRWHVEGDRNRNAEVTVKYRKKGAEDWTDGYPLLRMDRERVATSNPRWTWTTPNIFAGSVFDLEPGSEYEVRLEMTDPDGLGDGKLALARTLTTSTRAYPKAFEGGRRRHVYAEGYQGAKEMPSFANLQDAYDAAQPGDILLVHAGNHQRDLVFNKKASAERPIVVRGAGAGEAKLQGQGNEIVNVDGSSHHIFEDLTLYDADTAFLARGETHALTIRRCRIYDCKRAVFAISSRNTDFLVTDCDLSGPVDEWHPRRKAKSQGVWISGQGHVVCYSRIRKYWDGLSIVGFPEVPPEQRNCAIDFHNNVLTEFLDDAIEMDYGVHNIRVFRNLIYNTFMGISTQPPYGGPGYIFRNVVYNTTAKPLKLNVEPSGLLILHNTFVSHGQAGALQRGWTNCRIMNNLFIGQRAEWVVMMGTPRPELSLVDANAYSFWEGRRAQRVFWKGGWPGPDQERTYLTLADFSKQMGARYEKRGFVVGPEVFTRFVPTSGGRSHELESVDLRLRPDGKPVDAGIALPYFAGEVTGAAPDLGAYEVRRQVPQYGPRRK